MTDINHAPFGFVVVVRDRGQDEQRLVRRWYPDHVAATTVKHNLTDTKRYASVYVREATEAERETLLADMAEYDDKD